MNIRIPLTLRRQWLYVPHLDEMLPSRRWLMINFAFRQLVPRVYEFRVRVGVGTR